MNANNRIEEIKKRLKQGKYYVPYAPDDIEYLLSELSKTRLERNQLEANKNYYKEQLTKAKAEGRLVVLPCKVGDTAWQIIECFDVNVGCRGDCDKCPKKKTVASFSFKLKSNIMRYIEKGELGKTIFLTREAAEKALGGAKDGSRKDE